MKPIKNLRKQLITLGLLLSVSAGAFAFDGLVISEKVLQTFKNTFPNAQDVKWLETGEKYTVNFKENGVLTKIDYDMDGNFISSLRYYSESNLPVNILRKVQKKYADKKIFGVTEMTSDSNVDYYIKMEDNTNWITVKSNANGSMQVVEKYKKAP